MPNYRYDLDLIYKGVGIMNEILVFMWVFIYISSGYGVVSLAPCYAKKITPIVIFSMLLLWPVYLWVVGGWYFFTGDKVNE